ncbi:hypothetical protein FKR81_06175 [Lentzea tibetensis]|uniref:Uncharacterized protein n=1 Tax=Lentzea tibetensis TaxID=2591470 RepID=A0A563F0P0_9PSEU|nr:hypothetical protein [Lentzea tibetensis]TWP53535.1 hypothetical protein FKR81_06175 [Lentzea tibetensis]
MPQEEAERRVAGPGDVDWGGSRGGEPTQAELDFATALTALVPRQNCWLDFWLHADGDGTPWLLVSHDVIEDRAVLATLRLDFDENGIRGGWSPACLNWDDGVRAEAAQIDVSGPDGLDLRAAGHTAEEMALRAAEWFTTPKNRRFGPPCRT